ncbi:MAG: alpha/beta fold hydrolase [Spirochaetales bacterium]|nr:alpha/beta fold hydrolase [Spirochaetales bacterium]
METTVVKEALPLILEGDTKKGILIIHGFTGYTGEFYPLAHRLNDQGYTVSLPRLPGHGTNRKDFMSTGWKEWLRHTEECYRDLRSRCDYVDIIGLSMGGILALILSARYNPRRTVLMAPGMATVNKLFYLTPFLRWFVGPIKSDWEAGPDDSEDRKHLGREYWSVDIPRQAAQVRKLQKIAQREMKRINSPLLLMLSENDQTVSLNAEQVIMKGLSSSCPVEKILLKESHHVLITGVEKEFVIQQTLDWLGKEES